MSARELLELARRHIFSLAVDDAAAQLALHNMAFGLAKIMFAQRSLGLRPRAWFIAGPDATITRNTTRWMAGFSYGGKLCWDFAGRPAVVLDAKPNACGMLVGGLQSAPSPAELRQRVDRLLAAREQIEGVRLRWDYATSNHFIDLFRCTPIAADESLPPFVFVIHGACPELREPNPLGWGLYWDRSDELLRRATIIDTRWGPLRLLLDEAAEEYERQFSVALDFAARKRRRAAEILFGEFEEISNRFHQGLLGRGQLLLGCHHSLWPELLPLTLRPDLPAYLVRGQPNLSEAMARAEGLWQRAQELSMTEALTSANIVPHGGGYILEGIARVVAADWSGGKPIFTVQRSTTQAAELLSDPTSLPCRYRGRQVLVRAIELGLARPVARLDPIAVIKA